MDAEEYRRGRATSLKDALDFAPGVFVQSRFGAEESRVSIRGSGIQRTFHGRGIKLLQDGAPINLADGGFDFQAIEPLAARYIEVFRGANALEFGSTTLGGAINFVSFTGQDAPRFDLRLEYGSFQSFRAQIATAGVVGAFDYFASLTHFSQDGFREQSEQQNFRFFANLGYRISPGLETRFYVTYVDTDSQLPGDVTKTQLDTDPTVAQRVPANLRAFQPVARFDHVTSDWQRNFELFRLANRTAFVAGDQQLSITSFWSYKDLDHPILFVIDQLSNDFGLNFRYDNASDLLGRQNLFTLGFAPTYGILQDNRFDNVFGARGAKFAASEQESLNLDFYLQDTFYLLPQIAAIAGVQVSYARRDNTDEFPVTATNPDNTDTQDYLGVSPKLGLLWNVAERAQIFTNVSRSFEPPTFGELGNAANNGAGLVQLDPQTATTVELGTRGQRGPVDWDFAYYYAWLDDELLEAQVQPGLNQTVNAGRTIHQGVEAALAVDLWQNIFVHGQGERVIGGDHKNVASAVPARPGDRLRLRQLYLWNDFRFENDRDFGDNRLAGIPEHYYRAELLYEHPCGFYAGPNVEWSPRKYNADFAETTFADPYALLGFKVGYRAARGLSAFVEAKNLTDKHYAASTEVVRLATPNQAIFLPGDGRGFFGGIEWKW